MPAKIRSSKISFKIIPDDTCPHPTNSILLPLPEPVVRYFPYNIKHLQVAVVVI